MDHVNVHDVLSSCCENCHFVKEFGRWETKGDLDSVDFQKKDEEWTHFWRRMPRACRAICEKYKLPMLHETVAEEVWIAVGLTIGTRRNAVFGATETSDESGEVQ